jgi:hypothetical protein
MNRQERLHEVVNYLIYKRQIVNQKDLARQMGRSENNVSKAMHGEVRSLTDSFCNVLVKTFPEISLAWMLTGEGTMLVAGKPSAELKAPAPAQPIQPIQPIQPEASTEQLEKLEELSAQLEVLRRDVQNSLKETNLALQQTRADLLAAIMRLQQPQDRSSNNRDFFDMASEQPSAR